MRIENPPPFQEFDCYKIFHKKMGRWQVCMKNPKTGERKTILYGKFLLCIKMGRILSPEEQVDHVFGNKLDDNLNHLEIVTDKEQRARRAKLFPKKMVTLICPNCKTAFEREKRQTHLTKGGKHTFCGRPCKWNYYTKGL